MTEPVPPVAPAQPPVKRRLYLLHANTWGQQSRELTVRLLQSLDREAWKLVGNSWEHAELRTLELAQALGFETEHFGGSNQGGSFGRQELLYAAEITRIVDGVIVVGSIEHRRGPILPVAVVEFAKAHGVKLRAYTRTLAKKDPWGYPFTPPRERLVLRTMEVRVRPKRPKPPKEAPGDRAQ